MLSKEIVALINTQINRELFSAYLYVEFANHFYDSGLDGFANWYMVQAQEERDHAIKFLNYLHDNGAKVVLGPIEAPTPQARTHMDILKIGSAHEQYVTSLIHKIYDAASAQKDYRTMQFLDWYVKEQCEEEKNANELIQKMELFGDDPKSLYMLNKELGSRVYTAPKAEE